MSTSDVPSLISTSDVPFLGLNPFSEKDGPFFFGRDEQKRIIARNLRVSRITLLFGESGVGKSSLLQAGVVPPLRREAEQNRQQYGAPRLAVVVFRDWHGKNPLQDLVEQVRITVADAMTLEPTSLTVKPTLVETLQDWITLLGGEQGIGQLFLILDQFEEYFQYHPQESGEGTFASEFPHWVNRSDLRINFLIGIRQDALDKLHRFQENILNIFDNQIVLTHLNRSAARDAIVKPIGEYNLRQIITSHLQASRLSVLSGAKALGKSRVLRAISDTLEEATIFRSWKNDPTVDLIQQIAVFLKALCPSMPEPESRTSLLELLTQWTEYSAREKRTDPLLIILDQFEEFFQYQPPDMSPGSFVDQFSQAVNAPHLSPVHFLVAIRDEASHLLKHFADRIPNIFDHLLQITQPGKNPTITDLVHPITEPIQQSTSQAIDIQPQLVEEVLDQISPLSLSNLVEAAPDRIPYLGCQQTVEIEAPLLQLVMKRIWEAERQHDSHCLRLETLEHLGGVKKIVETHVNQAMESLSSKQQAIVAEVFRYLVTPSGTKCAYNVDDLLTNLTEKTEENTACKTTDLTTELVDLLEILANTSHRIVRPVPSERRRYEIFHDVLAQPIRDWRRRYLEDQKHSKELAEELQKEAQRHKQLKHRLVSFALAAIVMTALLVGSIAGIKIGQLGRDLKINEQRLIGIDAVQRSETSSQLIALQDAMNIAQTSQNPMLQPIVPVATLALQKILNGIQEQNQFQALADRGLTVNQAVLSPLGDLVVTSALNGMVSVWDLEGEKQISFKAHDGLLSRISFLADGQQLVTAAIDGTIATWDRQGKQIRQFKLPKEAGWVVNFSADGQYLVTTDALGTVRLWTLGGRKVSEFHAHTGWILGVSFSPDGQQLATSGQDDIVRLWDLQGNRRSEFKGHEGAVYFVKFGPKGQQLITGGQDGTIRIWNLQGEELQQFRQEKGAVYYLGISPDGERVATASADGMVRVWDSRGNRLSELRGHENVVTDISFSPGGKHLATVTRNGTVRVWNLRSQHGFQAEPEGILRSQIRFTPDGQGLITLAEHGISQWNLSGKQLATQSGSVLSSFFSQSGQVGFVATSQGGDQEINVWQGQDDRPLASLQAPEGMVWQAEVSPDQKWLFTSTFGADFTSQLWSLDQPQAQPQQLIHPSGAGVITAGFSADGQKLATASRDGEVALWDITSLDRPLVTFAGSEGSFVTALEFSPNSQQLVTASWDNTASLWNMQGEQLQKFEGHRASINTIHFSSDGKWLLTSSLDGTARVWDLQGRQWAEYPGHGNGGILDAVFSPNGQQVATISLDGYVQFWTVEQFDQLVEQGCNWLTSYLAIHLEAQKRLTICGIQERQSN